MRTLELTIEQYKFEVPVFEQDGRSWVGLHPLCDALGVDRGSQSRKVTQSEFIRVCHMALPSLGGNQKTLCLDIDCVGEWIFGINPNKVKPEIRDRMITFRQKLQHVLYAAVTGHVDPNMISTLVKEIQELRIIVARQDKTIEAQGQTIASLNQIVEHLVYKQYQANAIEKSEASAAGSRLAQCRKPKNRLGV
jgi:hypothetical protein